MQIYPVRATNHGYKSVLVLIGSLWKDSTCSLAINIMVMRRNTRRASRKVTYTIHEPLSSNVQSDGGKTIKPISSSPMRRCGRLLKSCDPLLQLSLSQRFNRTLTKDSILLLLTSLFATNFSFICALEIKNECFDASWLRFFFLFSAESS